MQHATVVIGSGDERRAVDPIVGSRMNALQDRSAHLGVESRELIGGYPSVTYMDGSYGTTRFSNHDFLSRLGGEICKKLLQKGT